VLGYGLGGGGEFGEGGCTPPRLWIILMGSMRRSFNSDVASSTAFCASNTSRGR
jgi:hypothetical protein